MTLAESVASTEAANATNTLSLTVLGSGSSGNCSLVSDGQRHVLIDAGFSAKEIMARLALRNIDPAGIAAILVTHEHSDHIRSVHTLSRRLKVPIHSTLGTFEQALAGKSFADWYEVYPGRSFSVGAMCFHPISLPHDAADPLGFRVECDETTLGHMTDFGYPSGLVVESLKACDLLFIEANHDLELLKNGPYPWSLKQRIASRLGHLSNEAMLSMLPDILHEGVQHVALGHLSDTNNDTRLVTLQMKRALRNLGLSQIPFTIARQDIPLETLKQ